MVRTLDKAKREAILIAAKAIFIRDGVAPAKISDIASAAKVAPGTLYLYFENKEALASAVGEEFFSQLIAQFGGLMQKIEGPDDVAPLVEWAARIADEERVLLAMAKERHRDSKAMAEGKKRFVSLVAEPLADLMSRGVIRKYDDPLVLADLVIAILRRTIMSHALFGLDNIDALKAGTEAILQHALFDDVTLAAYKLMKQKRV